MKLQRVFILPFAAVALAVCLTNCKETSKGSTSQQTAIKDPSGSYTLRSDGSIKKHPETGAVVGNGKLIEFQYDGSKGPNLDYQLYYVDSNGSVHPIGGSNFESKGNGLFTREITVFNSSANLRPGFMEITTVSDSGLNDKGAITGKNVSLGMYAVTLEVSE